MEITVFFYFKPGQAQSPFAFRFSSPLFFYKGRHKKAEGFSGCELCKPLDSALQLPRAGFEANFLFGEGQKKNNNKKKKLPGCFGVSLLAGGWRPCGAGLRDPSLQDASRTSVTFRVNNNNNKKEDFCMMSWLGAVGAVIVEGWRWVGFGEERR